MSLTETIPWPRHTPQRGDPFAGCPRGYSTRTAPPGIPLGSAECRTLNPASVFTPNLCKGLLLTDEGTCWRLLLLLLVLVRGWPGKW